MGRRRTRDRHLPPRLYRRHGAYWHVVAGKWTRLSDDLGEALRRWAEREGAAPETGETVGEAIDRYLREVLPGLAGATQVTYRACLARLTPVFGDTRLAEVRPVHVAGYLDRRSAKKAANLEMRVLSSVYQHAMRWGWCEVNPTKGVRRNPERARDRYPTDAELAALRAAADDQWRAMIDLSLLTALRISDLCRLRWSDWTEEGLRVVHQKTKAKRLYLATPALAEVMDRVRRLRRRIGSVYLFTRRDGQPWTPDLHGDVWRRLRARAGLTGTDLHWHDLRARALTDAARAGGRDYAQALAGHASGDQTEAYIRARETVPVRPVR